jgi:protein tyrosine phosphatase (PTP) superfamily phosphohydrolase (DUF442 family)
MNVSREGRTFQQAPGSRWAAVTVLGLAGALALAAGACGSATSDAGGTPAATAEIPSQPTLDASGHPVGLENYRRWSERIGQGGQPGGDEAFRNLAALGYRTILSVDGAKPDAETAAKYGLTYVHVPFGYNGVPLDAQDRIVKTVVASDGPVYIHCHHGQHRGPAGAMVARIAVDGISNDEAVKELKESGCAEQYKGLYRDVMACAPPTPERLAAVPDKLPSYVSPGDVADHMAALDRVWDRIGKSKDASWATPASMPDVDPPHEARMLWESFRETARLDEAKKHGDEFLAMLKRAEDGAVAMEESIRRNDGAAAAKHYEAVKSSCTDCHKRWRNN